MAMKSQKKSDVNPVSIALSCNQCLSTENFRFTTIKKAVTIICESCKSETSLSTVAKHIAKDDLNEPKMPTVPVNPNVNFNMLSLHRIGKVMTGLTISSIIMINAISLDTPTFQEVATLYGVKDVSDKKNYGFISESITSTNRMLGKKIFKIRKEKDMPKTISLTSFGIEMLDKLNECLGKLPAPGFLQTVFREIAHKHKLPFNTLALIYEIGTGASMKFIGSRFGYNHAEGDYYSLVSTFVKAANKKRGPNFFKITNSVNSPDPKSLSKWITLSARSKKIYEEIIKAEKMAHKATQTAT